MMETSAPKGIYCSLHICQNYFPSVLSHCRAVLSMFFFFQYNPLTWTVKASVINGPSLVHMD